MNKSEIFEAGAYFSIQLNFLDSKTCYGQPQLRHKKSVFQNKCLSKQGSFAHNTCLGNDHLASHRRLADNKGGSL